ncbi:MAG TPA: cation:proton antiporter, partial [Thermoanaerobaculia bacterium]|nr:cation:proton antiporter [Thermoanaerobaculia bacterium]
VLARTEKGDEIKMQVRDVAHFFVPIFFVAVGAAIDVRALNFKAGVMLAGVAIVGKVAAGFLTPVRGLRRTVIGVGMIPRGEVSLIFAQIGLASRLLTAELYSAIALMVVITAFITPLLLRTMLRPTGVSEEYDNRELVTEGPMEDERRPGSRTAAPIVTPEP